MKPLVIFVWTNPGLKILILIQILLDILARPQEKKSNAASDAPRSNIQLLGLFTASEEISNNVPLFCDLSAYDLVQN